MALLGTKKPLPKPGDVVVEPPPPKPGDDPPPPADPPPTLPPEVLKPPAAVSLLMSRDGGLNGTVWRAGDTVTLDPDAADFYLAKGYATRAK